MSVMPEPFFVGSPLATTISHVTLNSDVSTMRELREGERALSWFILPPFQRPPVWTREQQVKLLESIWLELPIGVFVYNQSRKYKGPTDNWLVDGQQRITAVVAYLNDEFPVFGHRYSELPEFDKRAFAMKSFPCIRLQLDDPRKSSKKSTIVSLMVARLTNRFDLLFA